MVPSKLPLCLALLFHLLSIGLLALAVPLTFIYVIADLQWHAVRGFKMTSKTDTNNCKRKSIYPLHCFHYFFMSWFMQKSLNLYNIMMGLLPVQIYGRSLGWGIAVLCLTSGGAVLHAVNEASIDAGVSLLRLEDFMFVLVVFTDSNNLLPTVGSVSIPHMHSTSCRFFLWYIEKTAKENS